MEDECICKNLHLHLAVVNYLKNIVHNQFAVQVKNTVDLLNELDE